MNPPYRISLPFIFLSLGVLHAQEPAKELTSPTQPIIAAEAASAEPAKSPTDAVGASPIGKPIPDSDVTVRFAGPKGVTIGWETRDDNKRGWAEKQVTVPGQFDFEAGFTYRLKVDLPVDGPAAMYALLHVYPDAAELLGKQPMIFEVNRLLTHALQNGEYRQLIYVDHKTTPPSQQFELVDYDHGSRLETALQRIKETGLVVGVISVGRYNRDHLPLLAGEKKQPPHGIASHTFGLNNSMPVTTPAPIAVQSPSGEFGPARLFDPLYAPVSPPKVTIELPQDEKLADAIRKLAAAINAKPVKDLQHVAGTFEAELRFNTSTDYKIIETLIRDLQGMGVTRFKFASPIYDEDFVLLIAPPDVSYLKVRELIEYLAEQEDLEFDVRVRGNDDPPTSTKTDGAKPIMLPVPAKTTPASASRAEVGKPATPEFTVIYLKQVTAEGAVRILEQLFEGRPVKFVAEPRTNAIFVSGDDASFREVNSIIKLLDQPAAKAASDKQSVRPTNPFDVVPDTDTGASTTTPFDSLMNGGDMLLPAGADPGEFSLFLGSGGKSPAERISEPIESLRTAYAAYDQKANEVAASLRSATTDPSVAKDEFDARKQKLRRLVHESFQARQILQRAELAEFAKRLQRIQRSIETRDRIADKIVDRRVEELLDPNIKWEATKAEPPGSASKSKATQSPAEAASPPTQAQLVRLTFSRVARIDWTKEPEKILEETSTSNLFTIPHDTRFEFRITDITGHHNVDVLAALESIAEPAPADRPKAGDIRLEITDEDFEHAASGNNVTKVLYAKSDGVVERIVSSRLDPSLDVREEAERRGTLIAVLELTGQKKSVTRIRDPHELDGTWSLVSAYRLSDRKTSKLRIGSPAGYLHIAGNQWTTVRLGDGPSRSVSAVAYDLEASPQAVTLRRSVGRGKFEGEVRLLELHGDVLIVASRWTRGAIQLPDGFDTSSAEIRTYTRGGDVIARADDGDRIEVSLGANDGIELGQKLRISSEGSVVGTAEAIYVDASKSSAHIVEESSERQIQVDDRVYLIAPEQTAASESGSESTPVEDEPASAADSPKSP